MSVNVKIPASEGVRSGDDRAARPSLESFSHVSFPCRDMEEGKRFYGDVLGGKQTVDVPYFASFEICGVDIGIGSVGCNFMTEETEYPHAAFFCGPDEMVPWRDWLAGFGIPTSPFWTRTGVEALMFFRDPSGNVWELFCREGFEGANDLPRGPARGHGTAVDIDELRYDKWKMPDAS